MQSRLWAVVLAGGAGRRLASVTGAIPKQFWRPAGCRESLLEQTLQRLSPLCPADRTVVVVGESHRKHLSTTSGDDTPPRVLFQPDDRGTAAGVLFGLMPALSVDPAAPVLITPADHGVGDLAMFRRGVLDAVAYVGAHDRVVLFGVEPSAALADYGWIALEPPLAPADLPARLRAVAGFVEKPPDAVARRLLASGAVWNTMVIVAPARTLFQLCVNRIPELGAIFDQALRLPSELRDVYLAAHYSRLRPHDFSREVLTAAPALSAYVWPASMGWSDLGTPDRLARWLDAQPATTALPV